MLEAQKTSYFASYTAYTHTVARRKVATLQGWKNEKNKTETETTTWMFPANNGRNAEQ